jgi:hypothetical protein
MEARQEFWFLFAPWAFFGVLIADRLLFICCQLIVLS